MNSDRITIGVLAFVFVGLVSAGFAAEPKWVVYDGFDGPGKGKEIVIAGNFSRNAQRNSCSNPTSS